MSSTEFFERDPVYTARRLHSEGQGPESNPFEKGTANHKAFKYEMELLQLDESKREALQP